MENFFNVSGYEGIYEVNSQGEIRNVSTLKVIKQLEIKGGYKRVRFFDKSFLVHRVVLLSFLGKPLQFTGHTTENVVCHIDDNPSNNQIGNLFLGTQKQNVEQMFCRGRNGKKKATFLTQTKSLLGENDIKEIFRMKNLGIRNCEIAETFRISRPKVTRILQRKLYASVIIE